MENGVEVVANGLLPNRLSGIPQELQLQPLFALDTETLTDTGLVDINSFALDGAGGVICLSRESRPHPFFRFSGNGEFSSGFGSWGEGPGELSYPIFPYYDQTDRFIVTDVLRKQLTFDKEGVLLDESPIDPNTVIKQPLSNGNSIIFWKGGAESEVGGFFLEKLSLFDPNGREQVELDVLKIPRRPPLLDPILVWRITHDRIFVGNEQRGYEILIYDFSGRLIRKIEKDFIPVPVPADIKQRIREQTPAAQRGSLEFPPFMPPYFSFCADQENRLYVFTFESGNTADERMCDIFTADGVLIARKAVKIVVNSREPFPIVAGIKESRLFLLQEKENGHKLLTAYNMEWKRPQP